MDFRSDRDQESIRDAIAGICTRFDDAYWLKKDKEGGFPNDFYKALAEAGWLGICMPEEYGGSGLGITEAAIMMQAICEIRRRHVGRVRRPYERVRPATRSWCSAPRSRSQRMLPPIVAWHRSRPASA